jgi:hypothetical protein
VNQYIINNLVSRLQAIFNSSGLNVVISSNPNAFEFQPFSTVFVTSSNDPITVSNTNNFGYSQHSDPYNMDKNDEGVVFVPSLASLGYTPSQADVDNFVLSLAAAVGRRAGELMGLRISENSSFLDAPIDIMSANSPANVPGVGNAYGLPITTRALSGRFDFDHGYRLLLRPSERVPVARQVPDSLSRVSTVTSLRTRGPIARGSVCLPAGQIALCPARLGVLFAVDEVSRGDHRETAPPLRGQAGVRYRRGRLHRRAPRRCAPVPGGVHRCP